MARAGYGKSTGIRRGASVGLTEDEASQGEATGVTQGETTTLGGEKVQAQESQREQEQARKGTQQTQQTQH